MDEPQRWPGRRWLGLALVIAGGLIPVLWVCLARASAPSDGTVVFPNAPPWGADGVVVQEVRGDSPLRPGDRVLDVTGSHYSIVRDGQPLDVVVSFHSYDLG